MRSLACFISANFVHYCVLFPLLSIKMSIFPTHFSGSKVFFPLLMLTFLRNHSRGNRQFQFSFPLPQRNHERLSLTSTQSPSDPVQMFFFPLKLRSLSSSLTQLHPSFCRQPFGWKSESFIASKHDYQWTKRKNEFLN